MRIVFFPLDVIKSFRESAQVQQVLFQHIIHYFLFNETWSTFVRFILLSAVADPGFSPGGGANSQKCYYFSIFCRKLHENERIWTPRGGARPWRPPLDPPMETLLGRHNELSIEGSSSAGISEKSHTFLVLQINREKVQYSQLVCCLDLIN